MANKYRYLFLKDNIKKHREIINKCKVCGGEGNIPTDRFIDEISIEYASCECREKFNKMKKLILAGIPRKRFNLLSKKTKKVNAINILTDEQVSIYNEVVKPYVKKFEQAKKDGLGLMFFGASGNGKTTASLRILLKLLKKDHDCFYIYFKDLISYLIEGYGDNIKSNLFKEIIGVDFLVVDELSLVGRVTPHMIAEFTSVCKQRFEDEKPTLLISNYQTVDEIYHNFGSPLESLMNEAFAPFKFIGKDLREDKYEYMKKFFE